MDVTPSELRGSEIKDSWRGYDRDEVDDLLERAAVTIEGLSQKLQDTASRPAAAAAPAAPEAVPLPSSRDDADMLQRTLLLAQRAADDAVNEAQARARQILDESEAKAQAMVSEAEGNARRIAEGERRRLEAEIQDLSSRREKLRADADALDSYASSYRDRLRATLEADLERLTGAVDPPSARPELHEIELPPTRDPAATAAMAPPSLAVDAPTAAAPAAPAPVAPATPAASSAAPAPTADVVIDATADEPAPWDSGPDTRAIGAVGTASASAGGSAYASSSPVAAPPRPAAAEWPPAPSAGFPSTGAGDAPWLSSEDEWAPAGDQSWDAPAPWDREDAPAPQPYTSDVPIEAHPVNTDSLDDDAFFASLREAVRDDAPLGPRDEASAAPYDDQAEQDRRRFRRRR